MKKNLLLFVFFMVASMAFAQLNEKVGIGVALRIDSSLGYKVPRVTNVIPNAPASEAGLKVNDLILSVDDFSLRDELLEDAVARIVGEEGTTAQLAISRSGIRMNISVTRKKYKYSNSFYTPVVADDDFCNAIAALMNDAAYDFAATMDTNHFESEKSAWGATFYDCKIAVPGATRVQIRSSLGTTAYITLGGYNSVEEVSKAGEVLLAKLKIGFPDYYYDPVPEANDHIALYIGKSFKDGYESSILTMDWSYVDSVKTYFLILKVHGGGQSRIYPITTSASDVPFIVGVRKIYDDIANEYVNVKGEKHADPSSGPFSMPTFTVDIVPVVPGAHDCFMRTGEITMSNGCCCRFFYGDSSATATDVFTKVYDALTTGLGSEFSYVTEPVPFDMTIPQDAVQTITYGIKKTKSFESIPVLSLVLLHYSNGKYAVNILFHDFGM